MRLIFPFSSPLAPSSHILLAHDNRKSVSHSLLLVSRLEEGELRVSEGEEMPSDGNSGR